MDRRVNGCPSKMLTQHTRCVLAFDLQGGKAVLRANAPPLRTTTIRCMTAL
jgi:hypothetical protein